MEGVWRGSDVGRATSWYCSTYKGEDSTPKCSFMTPCLWWCAELRKRLFLRHFRLLKLPSSCPSDSYLTTLTAATDGLIASEFSPEIALSGKLHPPGCSPTWRAREGPSLSLLRRGAKSLSAKVRVVLEPEGAELGSRLAESPIPCSAKRSLAK
jgi:hypothetical protein